MVGEEKKLKQILGSVCKGKYVEKSTCIKQCLATQNLIESLILQMKQIQERLEKIEKVEQEEECQECRINTS
jgi:hypothetical protein